MQSSWESPILVIQFQNFKTIYECSEACSFRFINSIIAKAKQKKREKFALPDRLSRRLEVAVRYSRVELQVEPGHRLNIPPHYV